MNISTGGPHILLFERDQQLTGLLISEFQLAGYECHTARTAVEVFDAIARQPIRLILVNLAQAAAARREFWVALDTQRRGRGVQVLTFHCTNIANYGPKDPDEHVPTMVDLEVDGMMGIMNLVDAVHARVPVGTSTIPENTSPRVLRSTGQQQMSPQRPQFGGNALQLQRNENAPARNFQSSIGQTSNDPGFGNESQARTQSSNQSISGGISMTSTYPQPGNIATQSTYSPDLNSGGISPTYTYPQPGNVAAQPAHILSSNNSGSMTAQAGSSQNSNSTMGTQTNGQQSSLNVGNPTAQPTYTEKIRAVLYPNQRAWSPSGTSAPVQENRGPFENSTVPTAQQVEPANSTVLQRLANGQIGTEGQWESGLAQLSRMVQERNNTQLENSAQVYQSPKTPPAQDAPIATPNIEQLFQTGTTPEYMNSMTTPAIEPQTENLSMHTLRASPIQDLPVERGGTEASKRPDLFTRTNYGQQATAPQPALASISAATQEEQGLTEKVSDTLGNSEAQKIIQEMSAAKSRQAEAATLKPANEPSRPIRARVVPEASVLSRSAQDTATQNRTMPENASQMQSRVIAEPTQPLRIATEPTKPPRASVEHATSTTGIHPEQTQQRSRENTTIVSEEEQNHLESRQLYTSAKEVSGHKEAEVNKQLLEKAQAEIKVVLEQHTSFDPNNAPSNALLLDIMQSLPPMPAPIQQMQPQVLSGRATRSLGSVLLEGHLVPQNRLEVAQNVQRMLRGVDLNYQLGEILLMFKLLTPDQLLAASLVSYGMINPTQITALGRIRQELHAIGLEYDLENLLIMFRILTTEQLREVRASW